MIVEKTRKKQEKTLVKSKARTKFNKEWYVAFSNLKIADFCTTTKIISLYHVASLISAKHSNSF